MIYQTVANQGGLQMKTMILSGLAALALSTTGALADPIYGLWKTEPDDGVYYHVDMGACGAKICGVFKKKFENGKEVSSPVLGKNAIFDMVKDGGNTYVGSAWRPSNNKVYSGKGTLKGNGLTMKGCVLGGLICLGSDWTRVN
jgi:uncharacterized protein (DUF2147 family)